MFGIFISKTKKISQIHIWKTQFSKKIPNVFIEKWQILLKKTHWFTYASNWHSNYHICKTQWAAGRKQLMLGW
jgi:hypothetical protein